MSDQPKRVAEMTTDEYRAARLVAIRYRPGMSAAEVADLAARRGEKPKSALEMTEAGYREAVRKAIRGEWI